MYFVGLDAGSVAVKAVVLNEHGNKIEKHYIRHYGHPVNTAIKLLKELKIRYPQSSLSITGSGGKLIAEELGIKPVNDIVSQSYSIKRLFPYIKTIIELGGEDSKLILLDYGKIRDFATNSVCAAGTGSFLEQQAERLRLSIEDFSNMAVQSNRISKIAGRCSVFAKSDMIHLQQIATPVEDIVAGLCFAVARNFKGTIAKGREIQNPVAFQGGVAANAGMIRAFREVFELSELFVPPDFALMGALGAAFKNIDEGNINAFDSNMLDEIERGYGLFLREGSGIGEYSPLITVGDGFIERHVDVIRDSYSLSVNIQETRCSITNGHGQRTRIPAYLGIDIGSISTNLALIDEDGNLLAKRYLMTAGRPIDAVKQGLQEIYDEIGDEVIILGVGTTGSGRYMIADYVGADIVKNEITAQATAAIFIDPDVDTIFEIGGQDSKYISIKDGIIIDFEMNKACAAGTGSFIEEQAEKLDISVKKEFAEAAFSSNKPCRLGERCTVFMENSLMSNLQRGADRDDLLAGLAYSIVQNYINRVVAGKPIGKNIFFQGGVAFNKAVVAAFEKYTGRTVVVPPNHDVTGAIGMAIIAMRHMNERNKAGSDAAKRQTKFKGFELSKKPYEISSFECRGCPNFCEINKVKISGEDGSLFYGGRCEKYDVRRGRGTALPDLFEFRTEMLWKAHTIYRERNPLSVNGQEKRTRSAIKIGIPYIFFFHDFLPFWSTLLSELGFEVVVSPRTNRHVINSGIENVMSETCFPVKVAHGHIRHLHDARVDAIFVPSTININQNSDEYQRGVACPYVQAIPYIAQAAMSGIKTISPIIDFGQGMDYIRKELLSVLRDYGVKDREIKKALEIAQSAQEEFLRTIKQKGREILQSMTNNTLSGKNDPVIVIIGRGYNSFDSGVNLEIPKKLSNINVLSMPMDMLPLEEIQIQDSWPNMYWRSGQRILRAARIVRNTPNLYAVYIGNFSCGPDSFILKYFKEEMRGKPFLHLEIDEHSADAGAITRCEAFLDSIEQQSKRLIEQQSVTGAEKVNYNTKTSYSSAFDKNRTIFIPRMTDHAFALKAAFENASIAAEILPEPDRESVDIGKRYLSGKECYPCTVTTGDMLKILRTSDFRPDKAAFFMPTANGPCRFGQYNVLQRVILDEIGCKDIPVISPEQHKNFHKEIGIKGNEFTKTAWSGILAYDILLKCLHESRPYEKEKGSADALFNEYHNKIYVSLRGMNGKLENVIGTMVRDFEGLPKYKDKRPLIGIIGEIFVRLQKFSNEDLIRKVEALGGEVWLAPMEEWIYYVNHVALRRALIKKDGFGIIKTLIKKALQKKIEHKITATVNGMLKTLKEPDTKETLRLASPYVHESFEGETVLSIGKAVDLINKGASGIINVMPFGCMPGTIVAALMKAVSNDFGVPCISIPYDGTESSAIELQLEAFMEATHNK